MKAKKMTSERQEDISVLLREERLFTPRKEVTDLAYVQDWDTELAAGEDIEAYWAEKARQFEWFAPWTQTLDTSGAPFYKWFVGGKTNIAYNAVDRHIRTDKRYKLALLYVNERGDERKITYYELYREVNKAANALKKLGVTKGDRVALYLPPCVESVVSMLACAKIGAVHNVVYAGFSVHALAERINDAKAKVLITADGTFRRGQVIDLKAVSDEAVSSCPSVETTIVVKHAGNPVTMSDLSGKEVFFHTLIEGEPAECRVEPMDAEDILYILYTSGSTGKPKGVVHTTGGYMVETATSLKDVFDIHDDDLWWCTADIGWVTGHSYVVYAPLLLGTTTLVYEGAPDYPQPDAFWSIVERYGVTKFYTAPTAIRHLMRFGDKWPQCRDLRSLRILGTVGEPINPEAWIWYCTHVGNERCPIIGHVVANRNGKLHDIPVADGSTETRISYQAIARDPRRRGRYGRETGASREGWISYHNHAVAFDAQDALQGPRTVSENILGSDSRWRVLSRGYCAEGRGRVPLDSREGR